MRNELHKEKNPQTLVEPMRNELHKEKHTNIVEASNEKRAPQRKKTQTLVEPMRNELHKEEKNTNIG